MADIPVVVGWSFLRCCDSVHRAVVPMATTGIQHPRFYSPSVVDFHSRHLCGRPRQHSLGGQSITELGLRFLRHRRATMASSIILAHECSYTESRSALDTSLWRPAHLASSWNHLSAASVVTNLGCPLSGRAVHSPAVT